MNNLCVYFIHDKENRRIKIGMTSNPKARLRNLINATGFDLALLKEIWCNSSEACLLESKLKDKFFFQKIKGEWFHEADLLKFINNSK